MAVFTGRMSASASMSHCALAAMRTRIIPLPTYGATVGLSPAIRSDSRSPNSASERPIKYSDFDNSTLLDDALIPARHWACHCRIFSVACAHMANSSAGTPGNARIYAGFPQCAETFQASPGAVPTGLAMISAPSGRMACLRLLTGMRAPERSNRAISAASVAVSFTRGAPKVSASVSAVRSSSVGPRPPVIISSSDRRTACSKHGFILSGSSPTAP